MKRVVIVGGGFGGLAVARGLGEKRGPGALEVTLIDERNHHLFQPLLYQVAMAGLSPAEISAPIRGLLSRYRNTRVLCRRVDSIDLSARRVLTRDASYPYDFLVLACGSRHSYFGHEEWEDHAPGLKTLEQATEIRRRVLTAFEDAEAETDPEQQRALLTFVIVGGGPTGVELAGAIGEMSRFTLARDFRRIDPKLARVLLIEAGPRILPAFSASLASRAVRDLESLGVQVWTSSPVTRVGPQAVEVGKERIETRTTLWAAGVEPSRLNRSLDVDLDRQGRVLVDPDLSLPGHPDVFVLGDQASVAGRGGEPLPGLAPVALQQGRYLARSIRAHLRGQVVGAFTYRDKGQMATIGRQRAVLETPGLRLRGRLAWLVWLFVHIYYLVGFKNRLFVVLQWLWAYVSFRRGARLIISKQWRFYERETTHAVETRPNPETHD
ncbi:MAG: NAD(P)/FAD-dependent oxidoreductase [Myxococcota bacterium]|nr:NAD(P)/FAD-dependent oxidoreductase [Myxococcota bacterium]